MFIFYTAQLCIIGSSEHVNEIGYAPSQKICPLVPGEPSQYISALWCSGVQIKTRKRNIAVAHDPGSFADAVVQIFEDAKDGDDLEKNLAAGVKVVEGTQLDFTRYGDTLFEVFFAGGRLAAGGNVVEEGRKLDINVRPTLQLTSLLALVLSHACCL